MPPKHNRVCSVEGCGRKMRGPLYCDVHRTRFRVHGDPLFVARTRPNQVIARPPAKAICSVEGCQRVVESKGLCQMHAKRMRHNGDPVKPAIEAWGMLRDHPAEYHCWNGMKMRCLNPKNKKYALYGGRGITVCDRWLHSFKTFFEDMGPRPSPQHTLDRIDNDGNYEPANCRWATIMEQRHNQRRYIARHGKADLIPVAGS